jgi:serum/glucocorticoid-regulated kinase 2
MSSTSLQDYLEFDTDKEIRKEIKSEQLLYSDKIIKINRYNMSQDRQIVITNKALYNFKKKSLKRRIELTQIRGVSVSKLTDEFVVHGNEAEYDYDYVSSKRTTILEILGNAYNIVAGTEMIVCVLDIKSLKDIVTLKAEKKKDPNFSRMPKSAQVKFSVFLQEGSNKYRNVGKQVQNVIYLGENKENVSEVRLSDFNIISVIGRGSFGKVCLVEYKNTGELYAMKSIKKDILIDLDQIENTLLEKKILQTVKHPFLCSLVFCFQSDERIYFVMNFVKGGELFQHLKKQKHFNESRVKFYCAQLGLALQYLHEKSIIYRDLKPENILMDEKGYLQLADFGLAKVLSNDEKTNSFCGTPEYLAPEIILEQGHNHMADWWSYGILL